jgi:hypothetical protein
MKKLTLGLATAGTLAAMTIGLASPAMAASPYVGPVMMRSMWRMATPRPISPSIARCTSITMAPMSM